MHGCISRLGISLKFRIKVKDIFYRRLPTLSLNCFQQNMIIKLLNKTLVTISLNMLQCSASFNFNKHLIFNTYNAHKENLVERLFYIICARRGCYSMRFDISIIIYFDLLIYVV